MNCKVVNQELLRDRFIKIALNISNLIYVDKFIAQQNNWNFLTARNKEIIISILQKQKYFPIQFLNVIHIFKEEELSLLLDKFPLSLSLKLAENLSQEYKDKLFVSIVKKTHKHQKKLRIEIINKIESSHWKSQALHYLIVDMDSDDEMIYFLNIMPDQYDKAYSLKSIISQIKSQMNLMRILKLVEKMDNEQSIFYMLETIVKKAKYIIVLNKVSSLIYKIEWKRYIKMLNRSILDREYQIKKYNNRG